MKKLSNRAVMGLLIGGVVAAAAVAIPIGWTYGANNGSSATVSNPLVQADEQQPFQPGITDITEIKPSEPVKEGYTPWSEPVIKDEAGTTIPPEKTKDLPPATTVTANFESSSPDGNEKDTYTIALTISPAQSVPVKQTSSFLKRDVVKATEEQLSEFPPSPYVPTGYYLKKGNAYKITLNMEPRKTDVIQFGYGQYGIYASVNNGADVQVKDFPTNVDNNASLTMTTTELTPANDGILYLKYRGDNKDNPYSVVSVEGNGVTAIPTYYANKSDPVKFLEDVKTTGSPFVEIVGKRTFATMQTSQINTFYNVNAAKVGINTLDYRVSLWDKTVTDTDAFYGFQRTNPNANNYIQDKLVNFVNPDHLADPNQNGATATFYRINMQVKFDTALNTLFTYPANATYLIWHEVNHLYQNPYFSFRSAANSSDYYWFGESAAQITTGYLQNLNKSTGSGYTASVVQNIKNWIDKTGDKNFFTAGAELGEWAQAAIFYQLVQGFGDKYFARLMQEYRNKFFDTSLAVSGGNEQFTYGVLNKPGLGYSEQIFPLMASIAANRNLTPYFEKWGYPMENAEINEQMAKLPALEQAEQGKEIWYNLTTASPNKAYDVPYDPSYLPNDAALTTTNADGSVTVGAGAAAYAPAIQNASGFSIVKASVDGFRPDEGADFGKSESDSAWLTPHNALAYLVVQDSGKTAVGYRLQVRINYDNVLRVNNWGRRYGELWKSTRLLIAVDPANSAIVFMPQNYPAGVPAPYDTLASFKLKPSGGGADRFSLELKKGVSSLTALKTTPGEAPDPVRVRYMPGDVLEITLNYARGISLNDYTKDKVILGQPAGTVYKFTISSGRFELIGTTAPNA